MKKMKNPFENELLGISKNMWMLIFFNSILVAAILIINFLFLYGESTLFSSINLIGLFIFAFPIIMVKYMQYRRFKELETMFPIFLRDFVESTRSGMTIPAALKSVSKNDYKTLTPYVVKMAAQLDWGVPAEKVLVKFSKESKSKLISRIISSVKESHRFGGNLADTFEALSNTAVEVERLREERGLYLHSQMITGYIIFFVFLGVIIGLEKFLVPSLSQVNPVGFAQAVVPETQENLAQEYRDLFRNLIILQGFFAGLAVGKMAEGAIVAGVKHSLLMVFAGALIFTLTA